MFDLARLLAPVDAGSFRETYWERKPLILERHAPDYYAGLLTLDDVDEILGVSSLDLRDTRVVREGKAGPATRLMEQGDRKTLILEAVYDDYRAGSTIIIQSLHERWGPLKRFCQELALEISGSVQANLYLTPAGEQGFLTHYDTHDVFVLQVAGTKHWRIYEQAVELPLVHQTFDRDKTPTGALLHEFDLECGDALYLPRGYMHDAVSVAGSSAHLTVGLFPVSWASVLAGAVQAVVENDARFRRSLPVGFARDEAVQARAERQFAALLQAATAAIAPSSAIAVATERAMQSVPPFLRGHLLDLDAESRIDATTRLWRRREIPQRISREGDEVCLLFHGKRVTMPAHVQPELEFILATDSFTAAELPGDLDEPGRLTLVRRLVREGFLTLYARLRGKS